MKICICCSLTFTNEVLALAQELEALGHELLLPNSVMNRAIERPDFDPVKTKAETDAVRKHIDKINYNKSAKVTKSKLRGDSFCGF